MEQANIGGGLIGGGMIGLAARVCMLSHEIIGFVLAIHCGLFASVLQKP